MADAVYRRFQPGDLFHTTVHAQPSVVVESGSSGWSGSPVLNTNALSLYGGVRSRADVSSGSSELQVYPIDLLHTNALERVVGIPGQYPQTGSINLAYITNTAQPTAGATTNTRWYEEHWAAINILSDWYHSHRYPHFLALGQLPGTMSALHVPEMFYGRQIATGSVLIWHHAWDSASGSNFGSGTRYYVDDGIGRLFDVPVGLTGDWQSAWMSGSARQVGNVFYGEGIVLFTSPTASWHLQFLSQSFNLVSGSAATVHVEFSGSTLMKSMVFMCRMKPGEVNCSNNPHFPVTSSDGRLWSSTSGTTYVTAIGIYNDERELVAVAKLAQPIRKRDEDNIDIRLRLDI